LTHKQQSITESDYWLYTVQKHDKIFIPKQRNYDAACLVEELYIIHDML